MPCGASTALLWNSTSAAVSEFGSVTAVIGGWCFGLADANGTAVWAIPKYAAKMALTSGSLPKVSELVKF